MIGGVVYTLLAIVNLGLGLNLLSNQYKAYRAEQDKQDAATVAAESVIIIGRDQTRGTESYLMRYRRMKDGSGTQERWVPYIDEHGQPDLKLDWRTFTPGRNDQ
jgi:hypothetical protein